jgi:hypothetical protein
MISRIGHIEKDQLSGRKELLMHVLKEEKKSKLWSRILLLSSPLFPVPFSPVHKHLKHARNFRSFCFFLESD